MVWPALTVLPGRILAPLLLAGFALIGAALNYVIQVQEFRDQVASEQRRRLTEILNFEQNRLEIQIGLASRFHLSRIVASMGLRSALTNALLVDANGQVVGAMLRARLHRPLTDAIASEAPAVRAGLLAIASSRGKGIEIVEPHGDFALVGRVAIRPDMTLIVRNDLGIPLALRAAAGHYELWRETALILLFTAALAILLHVLWFSRTARLTQAVAAIGEGRFDTRSGLAGRDELGQIGRALDRMADDLRIRQANLEQLSALIDHSPVVAIEWRNAAGLPVTYVSDSVRQWGYTPDELLSGAVRYRDLIHPEDRPRLRTALVSHLAGGPDDYRGEHRVRHVSGQWIWLDGRTWLSRDASGRVTHVRSVLLDVTSLKKTEAALLRLNATLEARVVERTGQLEAANRELESFSYAISHDLKAPLRGIDGYSQILLEDYRDRLDDEGRQFLANIRRGVAQMHELIEDLLAYAHIERSAPQPEPVSLQQLVDEVLDSYAHEISALGAKIDVDVRTPELSVDRNGLALALRNLVGNALKFSRDAAPPRIAISSREEAGAVRLEVRDNGIGFDMKYHDRIFGIFQRLHRADDYPGTGVGLALVRKAIERMGGTVRAESGPGKGATFLVEFPL
ncbi:putative two component sensor [Aromatoleum aromaticum EbN1]|uniref:histidine kinase n=1 Tax=Aromatoleum aromaticum (strain DSM 19018 / LMG 30748 / EbN1) TaxID=76114 RepID=Q5P4F7_AROAE|nr:ATP-binding protein [Aromatoleum aromaticum]CAI07806.1 putative two component sensor [Aromatoleum aromaticum EbN1]